MLLREWLNRLPRLASAAASKAAGFLGLPGFEAVYGVTGLLAVGVLGDATPEVTLKVNTLVEL